MRKFNCGPWDNFNDPNYSHTCNNFRDSDRDTRAFSANCNPYKVRGGLANSLAAKDSLRGSLLGRHYPWPDNS
ncbi:MAG: hypothetical protein J0I20_03635 [Chloroflexi bacterium]|nr:hypothetical protein [Chloroflexota bacterium]